MRAKILVGFICLFCLTLFLGAGSAKAAGLGDAFFEAEACAKELRKSPQKAKSRSNWAQCIDKFQAVYRQDPRGPWAPASLYNSGTLYLDLGRSSGSEADRKAAAEQFELLQRKFPDSGYRDRAAAELQKLNAPAAQKDERPAKEISRGSPVKADPPKRDAEGDKRAGERKPAASAAVAPYARDQFTKAEACFQKLRGSQPTESTRREWMLCIGRFHNAYLEDPAGPLAAQALYQEGLLYYDLNKRLKFDSDLRAARENFEKVVAEFPDSPYAAKSTKELQSFARNRPPAPATAKRPPAPPPLPSESGMTAPAVPDTVAEAVRKAAVEAARKLAFKGRLGEARSTLLPGGGPASVQLVGLGPAGNRRWRCAAATRCFRSGRARRRRRASTGPRASRSPCWSCEGRPSRGPRPRWRAGS